MLHVDNPLGSKVNQITDTLELLVGHHPHPSPNRIAARPTSLTPYVYVNTVVLLGSVASTHG